ncbi:MAG: EpsG family protein [Oscillospiraceae bacterium]|nr:EpsG family protein [Oscillospiraceae bacterium]
MNVYINAFLLSMLGAWLYMREYAAEKASRNVSMRYFRQKPRSHKTSAILLIISALPIIFVTGLRYRVGTDYLYYATSFHRVSHGSPSYFNNPLFCLLEFIVSLFTNDYTGLFIADAAVMFGCYWFVFSKQSENIVYSIFLLCTTNLYFISLNAVRQGLAMSVLFVALYYAIQENKRAYIIASLCAVMIHKGVVVFLPVYWLANKKLKPLNAWEILAGVTGVSLAGAGLLRYFVRMAGYAHYLNKALSNNEFEWVLTAMNVAVLGVQCFYYPAAQESPNKKEFNMYFWMQTLASAAIIMSIAVPLTKRLCWTFSIGQLLSLPLMSRFEKSKIGKIILNFSIIILFSLSIYIGIYKNGAHGVLPYKWITQRTGL